LGHRIVSYQWDFGDGSPAQQGVQVSHRYAVAGNYIATLVVTDDAGATGVTTTTINVAAAGSGGSGQLTVDFTFPTPTSTSVAFTAVPPSGHTITTYAWTFGDPISGLLNQSSSPNPVHTFSNSGQMYTVTLSMTDSMGQTGSVQKTVIIP
jgi:PKD repeat protein